MSKKTYQHPSVCTVVLGQELMIAASGEGLGRPSATYMSDPTISEGSNNAPAMKTRVVEWE